MGFVPPKRFLLEALTIHTYYNLWILKFNLDLNGETSGRIEIRFLKTSVSHRHQNVQTCECLNIKVQYYRYTFISIQGNKIYEPAEKLWKNFCPCIMHARLLWRWCLRMMTSRSVYPFTVLELMCFAGNFGLTNFIGILHFLVILNSWWNAIPALNKMAISCV